MLKAVKSGNSKTIQSIIQSEAFDPNSADPKTGQTSLHLLAEEDFTDLLKEVLSKFSTSSDQPANLELKDAEGRVRLIDRRLL